MTIRDPFWRRVVFRSLVLYWIPTLVMVGVGYVGAGNHPVGGAIVAAVLLYSLFMLLNFTVCMPFYRAAKRAQERRE